MSAGAASAASPARSAPLLTVEGLQMRFGGLLAVDGIGFEVGRGEIFAIIGPNGAGKTTVFNLISRIYTPTSGSIHFDGVELTQRAPHEVAALGIARTFQNIELFEHATEAHAQVARGEQRAGRAAGVHRSRSDFWNDFCRLNMPLR